MTSILIFKVLLISSVWSLSWCTYFGNISADASLKNLSIAFAPCMITYRKTTA